MSQIIQKYKKLGYRDLGWVNVNKKAFDTVQNSTDKETFVIGHNIDLAVCHDAQAFALIDSGD